VSEDERSPAHRLRPFVTLASTGAALILLAVVLARAFGMELVRAGHAGRGPSWFTALFSYENKPALNVLEDLWRDRFVGWTACAVGAWILGVLLYAAWRSPWPRRSALLAGVLFWLGFETVAPPFVERIFRLRNYRFIHDVDHIEPRFDRGWNSDFVRGADEPGEYRPEDLNLIFLGDSFTYGFRLPYEKSFPARVGAILAESMSERRPHVANFGWSSSSPLLSWRRLQAIGESYSPDWVVLCIDMTDFADDIRYENMLARRGLYDFYDRIPITLKLFESLAPDAYKSAVSASVGHPPEGRFFATEAPLEETRRWIEPLRANVERIAAWCRERSVGFVTVILPRGYQYSDRESPHSWEQVRYTALGPYCLEPFRYFEELAGEVDFPIVSLLDDFRNTKVFPTCFEDDPHWNEHGAELAARAIARELMELGL
jgi:hypothetical protein